MIWLLDSLKRIDASNGTKCSGNQVMVVKVSTNCCKNVANLKSLI